MVLLKIIFKRTIKFIDLLFDNKNFQYCFIAFVLILIVWFITHTYNEWLIFSDEWDLNHSYELDLQKNISELFNKPVEYINIDSLLNK